MSGFAPEHGPDRDNSDRDRYDTARHDHARSSADLGESGPPVSLQAEMSLLGSLLLEPHACGDVVQVLSGKGDFWRPAHGELYDAIIALYDKQQGVDLVQLGELLANRGTLEKVGGTSYLIELAEGVPTAAHAAHYAKIVRDKSMLRQLIEVTRSILREAHDRPDEPSTLLDLAEQQIFDIAQKAETRRTVDLKTLIEETVNRLENTEAGMTGVPSGFGDLDRILGGMQPGEMLILAARPSMGKTALALNIAENMAMAGRGVGMFSLEMGAQQLVQRLLCSRGGISGDRLRTNSLRQAEYRALFTACGELQDIPLYIDDTPSLTLLQLRAKARRMQQQHGIDAVVIDYLQLMTTGGRVESRQQEVSEISRGVKALARELSVPVICLSQLNRGATQRENHEPRLSDLRESGAIEQDADVVMLLHREAYYHSDEEWRDENADLLNLAEVIIAKQRNGPTGRVKMAWDSDSTRFRDHVAMADPPHVTASAPSWGDPGPPTMDSGPPPPPVGDGGWDDLPA